MSCAAIMVHVDAEGELKPRVTLARDLADRLKCELIGASAWMVNPTFLSAGMMVDVPPDEQLLDSIRQALRAQERLFRAAMEKREGGVHWRAAVDFPTSFLAREACGADLIVIGRNAKSFDVHRNTDAGALALGAGRPVLVVPDNLTALALDHVMVAWKDAREARRAIRDALPLLKRARAVTILEIAEGSQDFAGREAAAAYLQRHGVAATATRVESGDGNAGSAIVREAAARSCDLIVAGAYGHSRVGEWLFGGVTRHLLTESAVSCLLSH